ncbi:MAG: hypothetical protein KDA75_17755 [Planctomycetaceae bacterium]|nr:hypothetical protein [Planctomycetaceae bacterium]
MRSKTVECGVLGAQSDPGWGFEGRFVAEPKSARKEPLLVHQSRQPASERDAPSTGE